MTQFVTGVPGSGKSYYGIFNISIHFAKDLKDNKKFKSFALDQSNYDYCLTNINELNLEKFENVSDFKFDDFKSILTMLHKFYKIGYDDTQLKEQVKDKKFFNTLIVLDECHNYLNKDDEVLIWWLSYHRHFSQDIILITQNLDLVHKKYFAFSEFYFRAVPSSRKIFNSSMIYHQFTSPKLYKNTQANTKKLPIIQDIFALYGSGANSKQKSLVLHYLKITIYILIFLIFIFYIYISSKNSDVEEYKISYQSNQNQFSQNQKNINVKPKSFFDEEDLKLFVFNCFDDYCFYDSTSKIPRTLFDAVISQIDKKLISKRDYKHTTDFYIITKENNFKFLQKENIEDDKKNNISTPFFK